MIRYLAEDEIIHINRHNIEKFSPNEPIALLDNKALNMIVESPKQTFGGVELYPNIEDKSAIIFLHLVKKHVFTNANKRTALLSLVYFLDINGYQLVASQQDKADMTVRIAVEQLEIEEISKWIKDNIFKINY